MDITRYMRCLLCSARRPMLWLFLLWAIGILNLSPAWAAPAKSVTELTSSVNPSGSGESVTFTATVTGHSPSGIVTFSEGKTMLGTATLSGGIASFSTAALKKGQHKLKASYSGDGNNKPSHSKDFPQTVSAKAHTTTTLTSSINPSASGQSVTLTAAVAGNSPSGAVTFSEGKSAFGSRTLNAGVATVSISSLGVGPHKLNAAYGGDLANKRSRSSELIQTVNTRMISSIALTSSANPANIGQSVTLKATVTPSTAAGSVTFKMNAATILGSAVLSGGVATLITTFSTPGSYSLTAIYGGDTATNASTSGAVIETVNSGENQLPIPPVSPAPATTYEYDTEGNLTKIVQAPTMASMAFKTQITYDKLERPKNLTDARLGVTQFEFDRLDRILWVSDPRNLVTSYPRNGLGDATQVASPDTGTENLVYDAAGNLTSRTDSRGVMATYSWDVLGRLAQVVYSQSGQPSLTYAWGYDQTGSGFANGKGRLTSTTHPTGSTQYSYDQLGNVLTDTQRISPAAGANSALINKIVTYSYDGAGQNTSITYPSGRKLIITYAGGVPTAMFLARDESSTPQTLISQIQWQAFGPVKSWQWQMAGGTQDHQRVFDTSGRLVRYPLGQVVRDVTYDAADRITGYKHYDAILAAPKQELDQAFAYDELGRLTQTWFYAGYWSFSYDANGNRTSSTVTGNTSAYAIAPTSNRIASMTNPGRSFTYDAAGNTTADSQFSATYDLSGRMSKLMKSGVTTTYAYDNMGRRVRKFSSTGAASTVLFAYDLNGQLLGEYDQAGNALREYVWLGSTPIAMFTPDTANASNPPLVFYIHTDHIDTPRVVVDKNNQIRWRWMAEPFGIQSAETNPSGLGLFAFNLRFPGQYFDQESGLHYNWNRYYAADGGRYTQFDPLGLVGGINGYAYVGGNPLMYVDPRGLDNPGMGPYGPRWTTGVMLCSRPAEIAFGLIDHYWVVTAAKSAGMGANPNKPPGQEYEGYGMPVTLNDHSNDTATQCTEMKNVDTECVNRQLTIGRSLGRFAPPVNQCQSFAYSVVNSCRIGPQGKP